MDAAPAKRNKLLLLAALVGVGILALIVAKVSGLDVKALALQGIGLVKQGIALITKAGPVVYFLAVAFTPSFGVPLSCYFLTVGPAFGEQLGMPLVIALFLAAITFNLIFSYCLARWLFRPVLQRLIDALGYKMPTPGSNDATDLLIILRVTPGVPFVIQNYMAGLASVPFGRYLVISCIVSWAYNTAFIVFGDALMQGKGYVLITIVGVIAALIAGTHMVRRHYAAKAGKA